MRRGLVALAVVGCHGGSSAPPADGFPTPTLRCDIVGREPLVLTAPAPIAMQVADIDEDHHPDIITIDQATGTVTVLTGPDFAHAITTPGSASPAGIEVADFDHDTHLDLAVAYGNNGSVGILLGHGDGTFTSSTSLPVDQPLGFRAVDVDGDQWTDLIVRRYNGFTVLRNDHGSFTLGGSVTTMALPATVAAGDLDGDGDIDLVMSSGESTIQTYLGDGHGGFAASASQTIPGGNDTSAMALADLDGDGVLDLVATHYGGLPTFAVVSVLLGHGDGSFGDEMRLWTHDIQTGVVVGDVDGDHVLDIVTADNWNSSATIFLGNGDGTFHDGVAIVAGGQYERTLALADVDEDAHVDLVVAGTTSGDITVFYGREHSMPAAPTLVAVGGSPTDGVLVDLDGDGANDVVVAGNGPFDSSFRVAYGDGHGSATVAMFDAPATRIIAAGDVTGDGIADIVTGDPAQPQLYLLAGQGNRTFAAPVTIALGANPIAVALADLDGDHHLDIVAAAGDVVVLHNQGHGSFAAPVAYPASVAAASLAIGDVDGDHHLDVVAGGDGALVGTGSNADPDTGTRNGPGIAVLRGLGNAQLAAPTVYSGGLGRIHVALADIDGDGDLDLAAASARDYKVAIWSNDGSGALAPGPTYDAGTDPSSLALADVTGDGAPDLVISDFGWSADLQFSFGILANERNGTFAPRESHTTSVHPVAALVGDLDGDSHADVAVVNQNSDNGDAGTVMLLLETCRHL